MTLALFVLGLSLLAPAQDPSNDAAGRAAAAFDAGNYEEAARIARDAYREGGDPVFLYVQAQAERFGERCDLALDHYRQFLEAVPTGDAADLARDNIAECEATLDQQVPPPDPLVPVAPKGAAAPQTRVDDESVDEPPRRSPPVPAWYRDPLGGALVGVGAAALGVGGGLYGQARVDARAADRATNVVTYGERIDRAAVLSRAGVVTLVAGGVLVTAGAVRWILVARARKKQSAGGERLTLGRGGLALRF